MTDSKKRYYLYAPASDPIIIRVIPQLAKEIGLNESLLLLQIDFWIKNTNNYKDGKFWTYQSLRDIQEKAFDFWSLMTIKRTIDSLAKKELIFVANYNQHAYDKTQWFALNPDALRKLPYIQVTEAIIYEPVEGGVSKCDRVYQNDTGVYQNDTTIPEITTIEEKEKPLSPATQDDSAATLPTTVKSKKQAKVKPPTHPLRQHNLDKTPNPYTCAVALFWSGKPYTQWTASERKAEGFRFNKLFEKDGTMETLYAELDGFTPEQLARALQVWVDRHPVTPIESRPRENKLVSNIGAILKQIVKTDQHQVLKIGSNLKGLIQDAQPYTDWREHARIAQELAQEQKDSNHE